MFVRAGIVAGLIIGLSAAMADAQPVISLNGAAFPAGPDYASDSIGDAWDFSNLDDLSPFPDEQLGWTASAQARSVGRAAFLANGRFHGTTDTSAGNKISLLFRGGHDLVNTGRTGAYDHLAIPTARYGKLAIKMRLTNAPPVPNRLFGIWYHRTMGQPGETTNAGMVVFGEPVNGWALYVLDLQTRQFVAADGSLESGALASPFGSTPAAWNASALARGLEIRPVALGGHTVPVEVDWVRLTARDGQRDTATMTVNYSSCTGAYTLRVTDQENVPFAVARGAAAGAGTITFNYGVLAPGSYTASVVCGNGTSAAVPFTINAPPAVTVVDPDATGGADFASDVLGNPWDMADAGDVPLLDGVTAAGQVVDAGLPALQATGTTSGDPQVTLLNGGGLINSRRYRKLTFTLTLDTPFGLDGNLGDGSVARILWGSQATQQATTMTTSNDMLVWPGRHDYTIDLAALSVANHGIETDCGPCPALPWLNNSIRFLRIDPHESTRGVRFRLAQVKLTAIDEVALGQQFNVRYQFTDGDAGGTYTAQVFLDADRDPSSGLHLMGTMENVPRGTALSFPLTASGIAPNAEYFVYVRVIETRGGGLTDARGSYSSGSLRVFAPSSTLPRLTVSSPAPGSQQSTPFAITGCAYDEGDTSGINVDEVAVLAVAGSNVAGPQAGTTQVLGSGGPLGTRTFPIACPTASGRFANSGFSVSGIYGLAAGSWTLRVMARSTISGQFTTQEIPFTVVTGAGAPQNFTASATGNSVTVSFSAPSNGPRVGGYIIEGARNPDFAPASFNVFVPSPGTYSGALANGTYYLRAVSLEPIGARIAASPAQLVVVGPAQPAAPAPPVLAVAQATVNPVSLTWGPGPAGSAPTSYTIHAGTSPGASNLAVAPLGPATSITAVAPVGVTVYVRVVAANAGGTATSNEVQLRVAAPRTPDAPTLAPPAVSGRTVTLSWTPHAGGGTPAGYAVLARLPGSPAIVATLPSATTTVAVPAPPGTYQVSVVAINAAGRSAESNAVTVVVP